MGEKRLTFTVDEDTYDRLRAASGDESVDEWVRDAIRRRLDGSEGDAGDDDYDEPLEFVDDCAI